MKGTTIGKRRNQTKRTFPSRRSVSTALQKKRFILLNKDHSNGELVLKMRLRGLWSSNTRDSDILGCIEKVRKRYELRRVFED